MANEVRKARPSKDQVRVWLSTVLRPVVDALRVERVHVTEKNWTFSSDTRDFESLWSTEAMIPQPYRPNYDQMCRYRPEVRRRARAHDEALARLRSCCEVAFDRLSKDVNFDHLAREVPADLGTGAYRGYLAEYVVNGLVELSARNVHRELWKSLGPRFLGLPRQPTLRDPFRRVESTGKDLAGRLDEFLIAATQLQAELADAYELPPVDPGRESAL